MPPDLTPTETRASVTADGRIGLGIPLQSLGKWCAAKGPRSLLIIFHEAVPLIVLGEVAFLACSRLLEFFVAAWPYNIP
jgi:hypothetical protein